MHVLDPTIDTDAVDAIVTAEYGEHDPLTFVPVGGDSWCFRAMPWFVSVRRDRAGHFPNTYEAAAQLREGGLEFVLAPARGRTTGRAVHDAAGRPVVVFEHLDGDDIWNVCPTPAQLARVRHMVDALHRSRTGVELPSETFELFFVDELDRSVARALAGADDAGPYGAPVTDLVRRNREHLDHLLHEVTAVQTACRARDGAFVLTHGEPTNVFVTSEGEPLLADWGALAWGPRERDWRGLPDIGLDRPDDLDATLLRFYELSWILSEVAEYVDQFTTPHTGNAADVAKWDELLLYLDR